MNIKEIKLEISSSKLNINILLYRTVKDIIQSKISERQIIQLIEKVKLVIHSKEDFVGKKTALLDSIVTLSKKDSVLERIRNVIDSSILEDIHFRIFKLSLNILRFKELILTQSKLQTQNFRVLDNVHIMDFEYDQNMLNLPYSMRVSGALLIKVLFTDVNLNPQNLYDSLISDIQRIEEIDPETILQIIFAESASQSIRSLSGSSYEENFKEVLIANNIKFDTQSFDALLPAVEYDFKITLPNGKQLGVSAKRTLRERYKQNHENIEELEVDAMLIVTLGIDLNKAKVDYILSKTQHFIFVASDLYKKIDYLNQNDKVFPLNEINNEILIHLSNMN